MSIQVQSAPRLEWDSHFDALATGQRFATRGRTVTEADVVAFAGLTGDYHPQHADAEWARNSEFGQRIAHGMLIVSFAVGLLPFEPERVLALRRVADVVFKRPVLLGDTIHVEGEIERLRPVDGRAGLVSFRCSILNQSARLVCRALVDVLWRVEAAS